MAVSLTEERPWVMMRNLNAQDFIIHMLSLGKPIETTLVGAFDAQGRGSRRDIDLPLHRDGEYSAKIAKRAGREFDKKVDIVGLYCVKSGESKTLLEFKDELYEVQLAEGDALIFDNNLCRHGRRGKVGDRVLLRVWVEVL